MLPRQTKRTRTGAPFLSRGGDVGSSGIGDWDSCGHRSAPGNGSVGALRYASGPVAVRAYASVRAGSANSAADACPHSSHTWSKLAPRTTGSMPTACRGPRRGALSTSASSRWRESGDPACRRSRFKLRKRLSNDTAATSYWRFSGAVGTSNLALAACPARSHCEAPWRLLLTRARRIDRERTPMPRATQTPLRSITSTNVKGF